MHAVRKGVIFLGPAGGLIPQHFGGIEEAVSVLLAHGHQGGVVGVHLDHVQPGVLPLFVQRGNGAHDDFGIGPGIMNGLEPLPVGLDEAGGVGGGPAQVVGAEADNDPPGVELGHRVGDGVHLAVALELFALQGGDGTHPHAHHADVVFQGREGGAGLVGVHHVPCRVGIADEQRLIHIGTSRVLGGRQDGTVSHGGGVRGLQGLRHRGGGHGGFGRFRAGRAGFLFGAADRQAQCQADGQRFAKGTFHAASPLRVGRF